MQDSEKNVEITSEITRYDALPFPMKVVFTIMSAWGLILSYIFVFNIPIAGYTLLNFSYFLIFIAMRLGVVIYFIPFFFVFNPALVLEGPIIHILYLAPLCLIGIIFIAAGMEGYLLGVGKTNMFVRPLLILAGLLLGFPQPEWWWQTSVFGAILAAISIIIMLATKNSSENSPVEVRLNIAEGVE